MEISSSRQDEVIGLCISQLDTRAHTHTHTQYRTQQFQDAGRWATQNTDPSSMENK